MELNDKNIVVAGATGVLGSAISRALHGSSSNLALAGRRQHPLAELANELDHRPTATFEAIDATSCARAIDTAAAKLGGLDTVVITVGVAAFGTAGETDDAITEQLFAVNASYSAQGSAQRLPRATRKRCCASARSTIGTG